MQTVEQFTNINLLDVAQLLICFLIFSLPVVGCWMIWCRTFRAFRQKLTFRQWEAFNTLQLFAACVTIALNTAVFIIAWTVWQKELTAWHLLDALLRFPIRLSYGIQGLLLQFSSILYS